MAHPPKILMVVNDIAWFWSHRLPLAKAILQKGWSLHLLTHGAADDKGVKDLGITGHEIPKHRGFHPLHEVRLIFGIGKTMSTLKPDMVAAITLRYAFYSAFIARLLGVRGVYTIAGLGLLFTGETKKYKLLRMLAKPLLRFAFAHDNAYLIFQNPDDEKAFRDIGIAKPETSIVIRGSGVDLQQFALTPLPPAGERPVILFASRLLREKGIEDFVAAARILRAKGFEAHFQVAGAIHEDNAHSITRAEMEGFVKEGVIDWLGPRKDMPFIMKACTVFCLPSYYREGVPKVTLEALATGRPIITTDLPGCRETVSHTENGLLVPGRNPQALAKAIEQILSNREKLEEMGRQSRARAQEIFDVHQVNDMTIAVYNDMLERMD